MRKEGAQGRWMGKDETCQIEVKKGRSQEGRANEEVTVQLTVKGYAFTETDGAPSRGKEAILRHNSAHSQGEFVHH